MLSGRNPLTHLLLFLLLSVVLLANGCAVKFPEKGAVPAPGPEVEKIERGAAAGLLAEADRALGAGDFNRAELQMERALRVEPRNARVWHTMAQVRYGQGNYGQAVQFCLKSNSLAGQDRALKKRNWSLMAQAYSGLSDSAGAEEARRRVQSGNY
ncbi:MAG: tetratricopeptide repeat protein [Pseudomonadota bacterium]